MEEYTQAITREDLRRKLRTWFDGKIVRKDLTKKIKEGANVGALSVITKDVSEWALAITRAPMRVIEGWVKKQLGK